MSTSYEYKMAARKRVLSRLEKERLGYKAKKHHGKFENFDKTSLLSEIQKYPEGQPINWSLLARQ